MNKPKEVDEQLILRQYEKLKNINAVASINRIDPRRVSEIVNKNKKYIQTN
jgi:hypothetical protein